MPKAAEPEVKDLETEAPEAAEPKLPAEEPKPLEAETEELEAAELEAADAALARELVEFAKADAEATDAVLGIGQLDGSEQLAHPEAAELQASRCTVQGYPFCSDTASFRRQH